MDNLKGMVKFKEEEIKQLDGIIGKPLHEAVEECKA